ncbi:endonuclease NucS [Candidatus Woesearchaeota archaeon]|nr:endonuclease NucS [Candidatus Woesearchaeota archaeon]
MELLDVIEQVNESLSRGEFICLFCHCGVTYSGRAESYLDFGDRLIMIKQDRSVLIHQPEGGNPINYLRPPAQVSFNLEYGVEHEYILFRASCKEDEIDVEITKVYDLFSQRLEDGQKQDLSGNEAEMSDMIRDQPTLVRPDFQPLSREEHTKYGFIDVFGHLGDGTLAIVECKRYTAGLAAVTQLRRYVEKVKLDKGIDKVTGIMASPAITSNAFDMMKDWGFSYARVEPPKRNVRGKKRQKKIDHFF